MKQIFTLLLSAGIFSASYGQGYYNGKNYYGNAHQYNTGTNGYYRSQMYGSHFVNPAKIQMERINREYKMMVFSIQRNRYMSPRQKRLAFRDAKKQRDYQVFKLRRQYDGYAYGNKFYDNRR